MRGNDDDGFIPYEFTRGRNGITVNHNCDHRRKHGGGIDKVRQLVGDKAFNLSIVETAWTFRRRSAITL
jgi:hypothetical protein